MLFFDKNNTEGVVLIDASKLGTTVKEGKNQKTVLSINEEDKIINVFNEKDAIDDFSVVVSYEEIEAKNYSLSAGQYFDVKIEYIDITKNDFDEKLLLFDSSLQSLFEQSKLMERDIKENLNSLKYD